ncbi:MAG: DUF3099 domain-containing protein, partial [Bowdeniella nasicola]|nr:DUF3099 domain-containing protein [Bowdeniella nasicola]
RTLCVLGAAIVPGWWKWVFAAGAIVLPMLAVLMANAGREPAGAIDEVAQPRPIALPPAVGPTVNPDGSPADPDSYRAPIAALTSTPPARSYFHDESEFLR